MNSKQKSIMASMVVAIMLGTAFAALCVVDVDDSAAETYQGKEVTEIAIAPGMKYTWVPNFPSSLTVTTTIYLQKQGSVSGTDVSIASWANNTLTVNIPSNASSGTAYYVVLKSVTSNPTQELYTPIKFNVGSSFAVSISQENIVLGNSVEITPTITAGIGSIESVAVKSGTSLPAGLSISGNKVIGTPTAAGTYTVQLTVTSSYGEPADCSATFTVADVLSITGSPANGIIVYAAG